MPENMLSCWLGFNFYAIL